ncbi:SAV_2336 N-terminal domain-related protein [Streptomyces sp. NPDC059447]|uniref:SAV_2336 N-terminal domain-related protein n=1 Tax=Streptomyces sp. NPDC059447 TaxID=3346834 RepID=UPI0036B5EBD8
MDDDLGLRQSQADEEGPSLVDLADALWIARFLRRPEADAAGTTEPEGEPGEQAHNPPESPEAPEISDPRANTPLHAVPAAPPEPPGTAAQRLRGDATAPVRVGRESALADPPALSRALRPLKQRVPSAGTPLLDEEATARASGETEMLLPAWKARTERRFAVDLVVDTGPSMAMWHQLATELRTLFERHGAFRVTDTWSLDTGAPEPRPAPFHRAPRNGQQRTLSPRRLADPTGRRLLLLLTDGVGPLWHGPALMDVVEGWSRTRPVAVLQVLPCSLWHRTGIVPEPVLARSGARGPATALFRPQTPHRRAHQGPTGRHRWVPVLELGPDWLAPWARLVAGNAGGWTPMMALPVGVGPSPAADRGPTTTDPATLVEHFRGEASSGAFELAGYLSAVPLVLPVMRLVQQAMMPRSDSTHLAEFFLSGLLVQAQGRAGSSGDPDLTLYEFRPGVREALLDTLTRRESLRALDVVSRVSGRVARRLGGTLDFRALVPAHGASGGLRLPSDSRPFARIAAKVLAGAGGEYKALAEVLSEAADAPETGDGLTAPSGRPLTVRSAPGPDGGREASVQSTLVPDERRDPLELIHSLVAAATVRIHSDRLGNPFMGSGFFVAPGWVLTSAHVARAGAVSLRGDGPHRVRIGSGDRLISGVVEWPGDDHRPWRPSRSTPDMALIRVLEAVDHPCVSLTERPPSSDVPGWDTAWFGWGAEYGEPRFHGFHGGTLDSRFQGPDGGQLLKLTHATGLPPGMSGGPVVDMTHGEVIGVLMGSTGEGNHTLAVPVQELRRLPIPADPYPDLYQQVFTTHDLYHADRQASDHGPDATWTDARSALGTTVRDTLTAGRRTELLGMLARLPPPAGPEVLEDIVTAVHGVAVPGRFPPPRAWRDGLGMVYGSEHAPGELESALRYAVHAATVDRPHAEVTAAERALWDWSRTLAEGQNRGLRRVLAEDYESRLRARNDATRPPTSDEWRPEVLLEIFSAAWDDDVHHWRVGIVSNNDARVSPVDSGSLPGSDIANPEGPLILALAEAFRRCDRSDRPAPLQVAVQPDLFGIPVDGWQLGDRTLGAARPIIVRLADRLATTNDALLTEERHERWRTLHSRPPVPIVLDGEGHAPAGLRQAQLQTLPPETIPVLVGSGPVMLHELIDAGHSIVLWRREPVAPGSSYADFEQGIDHLVREARTPAALPAALAELRAQLAEGDPEAHWASGLALLYDDPTRPLPGPDPLTEDP